MITYLSLADKEKRKVAAWELHLAPPSHPVSHYLVYNSDSARSPIAKFEA
jgi:hypothetical protein